MRKLLTVLGALALILVGFTAGRANDRDETTRTVCAGSSFCTPSATTLAPSLTPAEITTAVLS